MNLGEFEIDKYTKDMQIVIYGAGVYGEYVIKALRKRGIEPVCYCDRAKSGKTVNGIPVYTYEKISQLKSPIVLIAAGAQYNEVADFLNAHDIDFYDIYKFCFEDTEYDEEELTEQTQDILYYRELYKFGKRFSDKQPELRLFSVDWVITERCSLRCKDCSNLMQYYHNPNNKDKVELWKELRALTDLCVEVMDVRVIGGEPFMHPELEQILREALKIERINNFSIYTNASILPSPGMIELMKDKRVKCEISDYGKLVKNFPAFVQIMRDNGIRHHIVRLDEWHKLGALENHHRSVEVMKNIFKNCYCNDLITLLDGKMYRCPYSAHGRNLKAIPYEKDDIVDIMHGDRETIIKEIRQLVFYKEYDGACGFCDGRNYHLATVPPAIQADRPLEYEIVQM